jgi:hypothetical protein
MHKLQIAANNDSRLYRARVVHELEGARYERSFYFQSNSDVPEIVQEQIANVCPTLNIEKPIKIQAFPVSMF